MHAPWSTSLHQPAPAITILKRLGSLGTAVTVLLGLCAAVDVAALATAARYHLTLDALHTRPFAWDESGATMAETWYVRVGGLQMLAMLVTAVVFVVWFHRARRNAGILVPDGHRLGAGWAIGAWFTPVVNLWFPKRIADDIWQASLLPHADAGRRPTDLWWTLWVAVLAGYRVAQVMYERAETAAEIQDAVLVTALVDACDLAAAVAAIIFVRRVTALQDARGR